MKTRDTLAALLAIFVISPWSSCGNLPADKTAESAYRLTYYPNGANSGKAPVDGESYAEGDPVTVQGNAGGLAKAGFTFSGWNRKADGTGTTYTQGQTFIMGRSDVGLYARWTANPTFTVSYHGNGATGGTAPASSTGLPSGTAISLPGNTGSLHKINPSGDGVSYCFKGWNTEPAVAVALPPSYTVTGDVTLYAVWTPFVVTDVGPAGGLIFYDKGTYDNSPSGVGASWRYMEAAPAEAEMPSSTNDFNGGDNGSPISGTYAGIGYGLENTIHLATDLFTPYGGGTPRPFSSTSPAGASYAMIHNGFDDWFLPSQDEMLEMYTALKVKGLGGFRDGNYWVSYWGPNWDMTGEIWMTDGTPGFMYNTNGAFSRPARRF